MVCKRSNRDKNREIRHLMNNENAHKSIGDIYEGMEIYGLTKGQYSIINIIEHILKQTGKADVIISTWTAANAEIKKAEHFLNNGYINQLHFIVDRSFKTRQPKYYEMLNKKFGDVLSETNSHAKFVLIRNEKWNIAIRTSMNLNENKRLENFEISDDKNLADYLFMIAKDVMKDKAYSFENFKLLGKGEQYKKFKPNNLFDEKDMEINFDLEID